MKTIEVLITRFVDDHQPGFVELVLVDAAGRTHTFIEKVPVISTENLLSTSTYPCRGFIACEVRERWTSEHGEAIARVTTERPWGIESSEGLSVFVVAASQLEHAAE